MSLDTPQVTPAELGEFGPADVLVSEILGTVRALAPPRPARLRPRATPRSRALRQLHVAHCS